MKAFWDKRYAREAYAYGVHPNQFFKEKLLGLPPGKLLLPAEGEGRNAVFAAQNGWDVTAFDFSSSGRKKARALARQHEVRFEYQLTDFKAFKASPSSFECIALIYVHMPADQRKSFHNKVVKLLKPGGTLLLESYSKEQFYKESGGPKRMDLLCSEEELRADFQSLKTVRMETIETEINEGEFHQGLASIVRLIGMKAH